MKEIIQQLTNTAFEQYPQATEDDIKKLLNVFAASLRIFKSETIACKTAIATLKNKYNPSPAIQVVGIDANKNCKTEIAYALRYT
jgi:hypothetical protein